MGYNPAIGRWMERDPSGYPDGMNQYEMVMGNPVALLDPMGLEAAPDPSDYGWTAPVAPGAPTTYKTPKRKVASNGITFDMQEPRELNDRRCRVIREYPDKRVQKEYNAGDYEFTQITLTPGSRPEDFRELRDFEYRYYSENRKKYKLESDNWVIETTASVRVKCECESGDGEKDITYLKSIRIEGAVWVSAETTSQLYYIKRRAEPPKK